MNYLCAHTCSNTRTKRVGFVKRQVSVHTQKIETQQLRTICINQKVECVRNSTNTPSASCRQQAAHCSSIGHDSFGYFESRWCIRHLYLVIGDLQKTPTDAEPRKPLLLIQAKYTTTCRSHRKLIGRRR